MSDLLQLWHYTCDHGHDAIGQSGYLRSIVDLATAEKLAARGLPSEFGRWIWLTDLDTPVRGALGLTSHILGCDRTAHRYRVTWPTGAADIQPWTTVRRLAPRDLLASLEQGDARPRHWYVSRHPVGVEYDPIAAAVTQ